VADARVLFCEPTIPRSLCPKAFRLRCRTETDFRTAVLGLSQAQPFPGHRTGAGCGRTFRPHPALPGRWAVAATPAGLPGSPEWCRALCAPRLGRSAATARIRARSAPDGGPGGAVPRK